MLSKNIFEITKGFRFKLLKKTFADLFISLISVFQAYTLFLIVQGLYTKIPYKKMIELLMVFIFSVILKFIISIIKEWYGKKIICPMKNTIRERCYNKLLLLGPGYLTGERTGKLESMIVAGVDRLEFCLITYLPHILVCIVVSGGLSIFIFMQSIAMGFFVIICLALSIGLPVFYNHLMMKRSNRAWQSYLKLSAELVDCIQGMDALKIYGSSSSQGQKLKNMMEDVRVRTMTNVKFNIQHIGLRVLFMQLGMSFTVAIFAYFFTQGQISSSILIATLFLIGELFTPIGKLAIFYHMAYDGLISSNSIADFLKEDLIVKDEGSKELKNAPQKIEFKNISFAYEDKEALFNNLNLEINKGEHIALVGESGSGKTTIFNLLLRFFDVKDGEILFDNCNIKEYKLKELRSLIAYVSQDTYLFHGTIKENLLLANPNATEEELISATKGANIHSFIESLPKGYNSFVGERGVNFSGGQRQRISIARALLKNAPVILLDEATASVDSENEEAIKKALDVLLENKTSITIAHRLNTIEYADKIIVLSKGEIVEKGTHSELMTKKATYYNLLKAQNITKNEENENE